MKKFYCDTCGALVFFENVQCLKCQHALGFLPEVLDLSALEPDGEGRWRALSPSAQGSVYRTCANSREHQVCNWLVPAQDSEPLCASCRLNDVIPNMNDDRNRERWFKLEQAKRRLVYTVFHLGLPIDGVPAEGRPALRIRGKIGPRRGRITCTSWMRWKLRPVLGCG